MSEQQLLERLQPILEYCRTLDVRDAGAAERALGERFPLRGPLLTELRSLCARGVAEGWLCTREGAGTRFSRVAKPSPATQEFSVDVVLMSGPGIDHVHPAGEIDLGFTTQGEARFDGKPEGWIVYPPGSRHVPTVTGGEMFLLYFLPEGKVEWITPAKKG
jgi:hypothetical protein